MVTRPEAASKHEMQYCLTLDVKIFCGTRKKKEEKKILKGEGLENCYKEKSWRNSL